MTWPLCLATSPAPAAFAPLLFPGALEDAIKVAAELGYEGVEVHLRRADEIELTRLRHLLDKAGLRLAAVGTGRAFLEDGLSLSGESSDVRNRTVQRIKGHIELAAAFGAPVLMGLIRGAVRWSADGRREERLIVEGLAACAKYAASLDTELCFEPINRYETSFCHTVAEALEIVKAVDLPNLSLLLDVFHMNIEESSLRDAIRLAGKRLRHFHFVDSNRLAPGWGHVNFDEVVTALEEIDFRGWLSAEILPLPDSYSAARQARAFATALGGAAEPPAPVASPPSSTEGQRCT